MKKMFWEEDNGGLSATRLALLMWVVGVLAMWIIASYTKGELQAIDNSVVTILGILVSGKAVQKFGEKPAAARPSTGGGA